MSRGVKSAVKDGTGLRQANKKSPKGENKKNRQKVKVSARVKQSDGKMKLKYKSKVYYTVLFLDKFLTRYDSQ